MQYMVFIGICEYRIDSIPVVVLAGEVEAHHMAAHGRHLELGVAVHELAEPFVNGAGVVETLVRGQLIVGQYL